MQTLLVGGTGLGGHSALGGCVRPMRGCISHPYVSSLCVPAGSASMSSPACTHRRSDGGSTGVPRPAAAPGSTGGAGPPPAPPPAYLNKALLQTATRLLLCRGSAPTFSCPPHSTSPVTVSEDQCVSLARNPPWPQAPPSQLPPLRRAPSGPPPWPGEQDPAQSGAVAGGPSPTGVAFGRTPGMGGRCAATVPSAIKGAKQVRGTVQAEPGHRHSCHRCRHGEPQLLPPACHGPARPPCRCHQEGKSSLGAVPGRGAACSCCATLCHAMLSPGRRLTR